MAKHRHDSLSVGFSTRQMKKICCARNLPMGEPAPRRVILAASRTKVAVGGYPSGYSAALRTPV
jgi:hypothetical protein